MGSLRTSSVFVSGRPTYLRFTQFTKERMVTVECFGVTNPGSFVNLGWSKPPGTYSVPPKPGVKVQVQNLHEGVLHIVSGEVLEVSTGAKPRVRVRVDENCLAVPLRKHPRHLVFGKIRLGQDGDFKSFNQVTPQELDISLGGFGLNMPDKGYQPDDEMEFCLDLLGEDLNLSSDEACSYEVTGRAIVRRVCEMENGEGVQIGMQFIGLPNESRQGLEHWIAVQGSVRRHG